MRGARTSWERTASELADFYASSGRMPGHGTAQEGRLRRWFAYQIKVFSKGYSSATSARRDYLDAVLPGWSSYLTTGETRPHAAQVSPQRSIAYSVGGRGLYVSPTRERVWQDTAQQVRSFFLVNHRWPSHGSSDADEVRLGQWLSKQRQSVKGKGRSITPSRRNYLDENLPGWYKERRHRDWFEMAGLAASWYAKHQRPVRSSDREADEESKAVFEWIRGQNRARRNQAPSLTPERVAHLDERLPWWRPHQRVVNSSHDRLAD